MSDTATEEAAAYPAEPAEAVEVGIALVLDVLSDLAGELAEVRRELAELRGDVAPAIEAVAQLGPMAEKMAQGGLLGMLRS